MSLIPTPPNNTFVDWEPLLAQLKEIPRGVTHPEKLKEMVYQLLKFSEETQSLHDLNILQSTIKEMRQANQLFRPYRDTRKVCIFGSARTPETDPHYAMAQSFAEHIVQKGFMVITGAGPGIMEAGNRGAGPDMGFGVNIRLPFEQSPNPYIANSSKLISFKYFFNRKLTFIRESDATILFPGGFGTHDEGFELLTLIQTGRCAPRPLLLLEAPESTYWKTWFAFVKDEILGNRYISEEDMALISIPKTVEESVAIIEDFYRIYHSIRYVKDTAILRLNKPLSASALQNIQTQFKDLAPSGDFTQHEPFAYEPDQEEYADKYRLTFTFDKVRYGRLYQLILAFNTLQ